VRVVSGVRPRSYGADGRRRVEWPEEMRGPMLDSGFGFARRLVGVKGAQ
jgi:hypothetical protein